MATAATLDQLLAGIPPDKLNQKIDDDIHLAEIARHKTFTNWKGVVPYLRLSAVDQEDIVLNNSHSVEQQRVALLRTWRQRCSIYATYSSLAKAFYDAGKPELIDAIRGVLGYKPAQPTGNASVGGGHPPDTTTKEGISLRATKKLEVSDRPKVVKYLRRIGKSQDLLILGESLGLDGDELKRNLNSDTFIFDLVGDWLARKYRVDEVGTPTWGLLVQALEDVGQTGLTNDIRRQEL